MSNGRRGLTERRVARPQSTPFPQDHRLRVAAENTSGPPGTSEAPSKPPRGGEVTNPPRGGLSVHPVATPRPPLRGNPSARTAFPVGGRNRTRLPPARGTGPRVTAAATAPSPRSPAGAQPSRTPASHLHSGRGCSSKLLRWRQEGFTWATTCHRRINYSFPEKCLYSNVYPEGTGKPGP